MDKDYREIFSKQLKHYMAVDGKTQADICRDLGFDKSTVSTWCRGTRFPRMDAVDKLAEYLHCSRNDLMGWSLDLNVTEKMHPYETIILNYFRELNQEGKDVLIEYAQYLIATGRYKKRNTAELVEEQDWQIKNDTAKRYIGE